MQVATLPPRDHGTRSLTPDLNVLEVNMTFSNLRPNMLDTVEKTNVIFLRPSNGMQVVGEFHFIQ